MNQQVTIAVHGRVQGVFYRASTKKKAQQLGLSGTVENRSDGSVYIIVSGEKEKIEELISWCRIGPPLAKIDKLEVAEDDSRIPKGFNIKY